MTKFLPKAAFGIMLLAGGAFGASAQDVFPQPFLYSPIPGISWFSTICVTWDYVELTAGPAENRQITVTCPDGTEFTAPGYTEYVLEEDNGNTFDQSNPDGANAISASFYKQLAALDYFAGSFYEAGIYNIHIPEGAVYINETPNPAADITYVLGDIAFMDDAEWEVVTEDNVPYLRMTWGETLKKTRAAANGGMGGFLVDVESGKEIEFFSGSFTFNDDNTVISVDLSNSLAEGQTYTFQFPGYMVMNLNGEVNREQLFEFTYSASGIESIIDSADSYAVYDLRGVKLMETKDVSSLNSLHGVYVVNGKKVVLK